MVLSLDLALGPHLAHWTLAIDVSKARNKSLNGAIVLCHNVCFCFTEQSTHDPLSYTSKGRTRGSVISPLSLLPKTHGAGLWQWGKQGSLCPTSPSYKYCQYAKSAWRK